MFRLLLGLMGNLEADGLCRNGKYTIKLQAPGGLVSANLSKERWFLFSVKRVRLGSKQTK